MTLLIQVSIKDNCYNVENIHIHHLTQSVSIKRNKMFL